MKSNILLIYDESRTLDLFKIETQDVNFFIEAVQSYKEADDKINDRNYDIVIISMDININESLELISKIRKKSLFIDIISYAHFNLLDKILLAYKNGANDFIEAPIEPKILKAKIISLSQKYEILNAKYFSNFVKYGDFVVDRESNIVYLNTVPLHLSLKEYRILRTLMKAEGKIVSKFDIQKNVWGFNDPMSKSVDVTISNLKKKLNNKYIKTILREGYLITETN